LTTRRLASRLLVAWLHRLYCAYAVHPDVPSHYSTFRRSVALALALCPVILSRDSPTLCATAVTSSCGHTGPTSATSCVTTTCLAATLALLLVRRAPPRHHFPVASRRPLILTSFPN
jgi:hypothetical protein